MAAIARRGIYKPPRLFLELQNSKFEILNSDGLALDISPETLDVVYDGMRAVVSEYGGTASEQFRHGGLTEQGVIVYGKTGSTEAPYVAWFAGFARDSAGRSIAIAVVVEGGQSGPSDAAPLARDIIQFCIEEGYIGQPTQTWQ
jgi:peptidoglycan glycosyltransferase